MSGSLHVCVCLSLSVFLQVRERARIKNERRALDEMKDDKKYALHIQCEAERLKSVARKRSTDEVEEKIPLLLKMGLPKSAFFKCVTCT